MTSATLPAREAEARPSGPGMASYLEVSRVAPGMLAVVVERSFVIVYMDWKESMSGRSKICCGRVCYRLLMGISEKRHEQ